MGPLRFDLDRPTRRRVAGLLNAANLVFMAGMTVFLYYYNHRGYYGPRGRAFIDHVLVQFHLGAENVVAAWYSSMLLLLVALACGLAFALDRRQVESRSDRLLAAGWLLMAAAFVVLSLDEVGSFHERLGMVAKLNAASIAPGATHAVGWVYLLAIPIAAVALFMLAFGWIRLRRAPMAFALLAAGVFLYVSDPFLELIEQTLATTSVSMYVERLLEEGIAELGGTTCVLFGVLLYAAKRGGAGTHSFALPPRALRLAAGALLVLGVPISHVVVQRLPPGDVGIPDNWFPAAAFFLVAVMWMATRRAWGAGIIVILVSAYFGAGLFGYARWYATLHYNRVAIDMIATAVPSLLIALSRSPTP